MTLAIVMAGVGFVVLSGLAGCTRSSHRDQSQASPLIVPESPATSPALFTGANAVQPQALSLLAQPLYPPELPPEVRAQRQEQLYEAQLVYDRDPHDQDAIIWLGRRQAYLGDFRAAIDTFSNGLAIDPASYKLLRHRGHRFTTLRDLDRAVADLSEAAAIIESANIADEVEPDGQPNDRNIPTSTSHTNIYYHLGLALYLQGDFAGAAEGWRKCLAFATNDDMRVAATYWRYLSLMRAAQDQQAQALLATVRPSMEIIENTSYHQLLLMFKEQAQPQALLPGDGVGGDVSVDVATIGYGLGVRELLLGNMLAARQHFQRVVAETNWAAFGHIAAEAELARGR